MNPFRSTENRLAQLLCLDDFERAAREFLPRPIFGYIAGAAETNASHDQNRSAFQQYGFIPKVLVNIAARSQSVSLLGKTYAAPFGIAPLGLSALSAYRGDIILARAAAAMGIPMIMSGSSLIRLEEVAAVSKNSWFQAYLPGDEAGIVALIERVKRAGFGTLVITVDTPVAANRENNVRAGFSTPLRPNVRLALDGMTHPRWLFGTFFRTLAKHGMPYFENNYVSRGAPILSPNVVRDFSDRGHLTWKHIEMIRAIWQGDLVIKGILNPTDAVAACKSGADAIIVSNHGGRQLDGAIAPLLALPGIVSVCGKIPVMMDSGIRRGTDVLKALALGAKFVFIGRPFAYAAAVGGEAGIKRAITILAEEISRDMAMMGIDTLDKMQREQLLTLPCC